MAEIRPRATSKIRANVLAGQTKDIDTNGIAAFNGLRYFLTAWGNSRSKSLDMTVSRDNGLLTDSVFARAGALPLAVNAVEVSGNVLIRINNPNAFAVDVELCKFILGA